MAVYVDDMYKYPIGEFGRMKMSHLMADTTEELLAMADAIGVDRKWIQYPGTRKEHFDIAVSKRSKAIKAGAVEVTMRKIAFFCNEYDERTREDQWWDSGTLDRKELRVSLFDSGDASSEGKSNDNTYNGA